MQGTSLTKQERECKLYDAFDKFTHIKGESLHTYYLRFTQLINDMSIYNMKMEQFQVNTKFLNSLPPEWRDDPIACLNKEMPFLTAIASSRFPSTNNQLRTSSNTRNQATIQDGRVTVQQVHGDKGKIILPKRQRNDAWYKEKVILAEAQEAGQILDEEQLAFPADPGIPAVIMANISNYGSDVISEEKANKEQNKESITAELERYKERVKTFEQRLNIDLSSREKMIDSQMDDMIKEKLALKEKNCWPNNLSGYVYPILPLNLLYHMSEWKFPVNYLRYIQRSESCEKCLNLDDESFKSKQAYNDHLNKYSQLEKYCISLEVSMQLKEEVFQSDESCVCQNAPVIPEYFEKNDLKAQLKDKDTTICKLKDTIKSLRENNKEEIVDHDRCDLATINAELENRSIATDIPSSSSLVMIGCPNCTLIARIMGYGEYQLRNVVILRIYYVEGLGHNLFSVGQFCDVDLEVAFQKNACFIRDLEAINTACYTQNRSLIRHRYNKTPYELMQNKKPNLSFLYVFGSLCYPTNDHDDLGKFDAKADIGIFVGYAPAKKAFRIYNRRTQIIYETIHVTFDELTTMASEQFSSGPGLHVMTPVTLIQEATAPRAEVLVDSPVSISISQDTLSTSIPSSQAQEHS
nr:retrovirus-related Pol polyprotein from transposon TNT 1-94 [Tanacetum cinerariifolium]